MITKHLIVGTPDWTQFQHQYYHDHEAPIIMTKGLTDSDISEPLATWQKAKFHQNCNTYANAYLQQFLLEPHAKAKQQVRRLVSNAIGEHFREISGISTIDSRFAANLDGYERRENVIFKYHPWHEEVAKFLRTHNDLPDHLWPEIEHQLFVSQAKYCIYVISDGSAEKWMSIRYSSIKGRSNRLLNQWNTVQQRSRGTIQEKQPIYQIRMTETANTICA